MVESIAECSPWGILQYFWPALSDNWSWKPIFGIFEIASLDVFFCILLATICLNQGWNWCRETGLSPPVKYFNWLFQGGTSLVDQLCYLWFVFAFTSCGHLLRKGWSLGSYLWCLIVFLSLFHVVSWVRCGMLLYWFLTFAFFLTLKLLTHWKAFPPSEFLSASVYSGGMLQTVDNSKRYTTCKHIQFSFQYVC